VAHAGEYRCERCRHDREVCGHDFRRASGLRTEALSDTGTQVKENQHCINRNSDGSQTEYLPAAIHRDGTTAIARAGVIEIRGTWSDDAAVPADRLGQVDWVDFGPTGNIAIGFKDKTIGWLIRERRRIEIIEP
jgi:hypothetical protein